MAGAWLRRLLERLGAARPVAPSSPLAERIDAIWRDRQRLGSAAELLAALDRAIGDGPLDDGAVARLASHLGGGFGSEYAAMGGHLDEHLAFWCRLAARTGHPHAAAFHADLLLASGQPAAALAELGRALAADPAILAELGDELPEAARAAGGAPWLEVRLAGLRGLIAAAGREPGGDGADGDLIRELYGELYDEHRHDDVALAPIRAVGREIDAAVARGELPRALVRRGPRSV